MGLPVFISFFFRHDFVRALSLEPLLAETPNWMCCMVLRSNVHCCLPSNLLRYFFFLFNFFFFFRQHFVRAISLEPLLAETPNWVCCLVLRSNFALLLAIQFASLFFFSPRFCPGHISGTITRRDSKLSVLLGPAVQFCTVAYHPIRFVIFFSATILSGPYLWSRYSQRLQIECAAWSCGLILHCCLPSN